MWLNADRGEVDAAFASAFLVFMGVLMWPSWYGFEDGGWLRLLAVPVVCALAVGGPGWAWRLKFAVWAVWMGTWLAGPRSWGPDGSSVIWTDHVAFALLLALLAINGLVVRWGLSRRTSSE